MVLFKGRFENILVPKFNMILVVTQNVTIHHHIHFQKWRTTLSGIKHHFSMQLK